MYLHVHILNTYTHISECHYVTVMAAEPLSVLHRKMLCRLVWTTQASVKEEEPKDDYTKKNAMENTSLVNSKPRCEKTCQCPFDR